MEAASPSSKPTPTKLVDAHTTRDLRLALDVCLVGDFRNHTESTPPNEKGRPQAPLFRTLLGRERQKRPRPRNPSNASTMMTTITIHSQYGKSLPSFVDAFIFLSDSRFPCKHMRVHVEREALLRVPELRRRTSSRWRPADP